MDMGQVNKMIRIGIAVWLIGILFSLPALALESDYSPYIQCVEEHEAEDVDLCLDKVGRSEWVSAKSLDSCIVNKQILEFADQNNWTLSWEVLFINERCRRTDEPFYERANQRE